MLTFVLGPFSASLVARWGVRPVIMLGSVLFSIGAFLTAATNETWHAILTYVSFWVQVDHWLSLQHLEYCLHISAEGHHLLLVCLGLLVQWQGCV